MLNWGNLDIRRLGIFRYLGTWGLRHYGIRDWDIGELEDARIGGDSGIGEVG